MLYIKCFLFSVKACSEKKQKSKKEFPSKFKEELIIRIQYNIMSLNACCNYTTNTGALSKNVEKSSPGCKINRAGNDSAGLAVSEKMRAQITGVRRDHGLHQEQYSGWPSLCWPRPTRFHKDSPAAPVSFAYISAIF